jgi:Ca2+-binding RTX toxin-like protein
VGTSDSNVISGLEGDDRVNGCWGDDRINGNADDDGIAGGPGNDDLSGNEGDDVMQGDSGNDRLDGGAGVNFLTGGQGRDLFICDPQGETYLTDFVFSTDGLTGPCIIEDTTTTVAQARVERSTAPTGSTLSSVPQEILSIPLPLPY